MDPNVRNTQAAFMAATSAVTSRFTDRENGLHRRVPWPQNAPARIRPPALHDIPSLLEPPEADELEDPRRRVTRFATAALLYAFERKSDGHARRLLRSGRELDLLDHVAGLDTPKRNETCSYCRIFNGLCYFEPGSPGEFAPAIEPLSHEARTTPSFDAETNVSTGTLSGQQWLVRGRTLALEMLLQAHPLLWHEAVPDLFRRSAPAREAGIRPHSDWETAFEDEPMKDRFARWTQTGERNEYVWEDVTWPWNQDISSDISNVIRIERLELHAGASEILLAYRYALEACIQSSFGVSFERSGLDVDGGYYRGSAKPISCVGPEELKDLTERDLAHLGAAYRSPREKSLYEYRSHAKNGDSGAFALRAHAEVNRRAGELKAAWNEEPWLVTTSAMKRLRFTAPLNGPIELWAALTNGAPALLVNFLNQSLCLPPHQAFSPAIQGVASSLSEQRASKRKRA